MAPRPSEVKLVTKMLQSEEWEDETECARAIISRLDEHRGKERKAFCLAVQYGAPGSLLTLLYGPYSTRKQAELAYKKGTGQIDGAQVAIFPLVSPEQGQAATEQADT